MVQIAAGCIIVIGLAAGLWWYFKRANHLSAKNDARYDFQKDLLLNLQDIRDTANGELANALDELIEIVRYDTTATSVKTAELDAQISAEAHRLAEDPTAAAIESLRDKLISRNRRAKH